MPFASQTFSVGQVLTASQMNQVDTNIDAVRTSHKGSSAPPDLAAGVQWLDDSATPWTQKMYDGAAQVPMFTLNASSDVAYWGAYGLSLGAEKSADFTVVAGTFHPVECVNSGHVVTWPNSPVFGEVFGLAQYGTQTLTHSLASWRYKGSTTSPGPSAGDLVGLFFFTGSERGWIDL